MSSGEGHVIQVIIHEHILFRVVDQIRGYDSLRARGGRDDVDKVQGLSKKRGLS